MRLAPRCLSFVAWWSLSFCFAAAQTTRLSLDGKWTLAYGPCDAAAPATPVELARASLPSVPAEVPGNVELDLLRAGRIANPEIGNHVYDLRRFESYRWWYQRTFSVPPTSNGHRLSLVFDGLDCLGTIWVNGQLAGNAEDMLIEQAFDVTKLVHSGDDNLVEVRIDPVVPAAQQHLIGAIGSIKDGRQEYVYIRKAPHMYGWDIMPRLISAGLWRSVHLDVLPPSRLRSAYWMTNRIDRSRRSAQLLLDWQLETNQASVDGLRLKAVLSRHGRTCYEASIPVTSFCGESAISLDHADFWWPRGYGEPALYEASLELTDASNHVLDRSEEEIGIRTAELVRSETVTDEDPGEFLFKVNGVPIFVRGTNWVPLDALHSRDRSHLREVFAMVPDLNCNLLRSWGGSVYEDTEFFQLCDRNGIMVWQDFALACTMYPQDPQLEERIRQEAIAVVMKLRGHPSLVLWSGNNEDDASVSWVFAQPPNPALDAISREVLPRVVWEYDPLRPYLPSSPYHAGASTSRRAGNESLPEVHQWGPRGYYKAPFYTETKAHFVSEIGYHGCPNRASLERMFDPPFVYPWDAAGRWNDEWQTKAVRATPASTTEAHRNDFMVKQASALFGSVPKDLDGFIFASQATQAEALKSFIEFWRMGKFRRSGIVWWNLRDGWPIISDAVVDFYGGRKLAYAYIKRAQADACVMIGDPSGGAHPVVAVNDTLEAKSGTVRVRDVDSGRVLLDAPFTIPPNGRIEVGRIPEQTGQAMWSIDYTAGDQRLRGHYLAGAPPFRLADYHRWFDTLHLGSN